MKQKSISLRITQIEYEFLKQRSTWFGISVSEYISKLIIIEMAKVTESGVAMAKAEQ